MRILAEAITHADPSRRHYACVRVCACARACVRMCKRVHACVSARMWIDTLCMIETAAGRPTLLFLSLGATYSHRSHPFANVRGGIDTRDVGQPVASTSGRPANQSSLPFRLAADGKEVFPKLCQLAALLKRSPHGQHHCDGDNDDRQRRR